MPPGALIYFYKIYFLGCVPNEFPTFELLRHLCDSQSLSVIVTSSDSNYAIPQITTKLIRVLLLV